MRPWIIVLSSTLVAVIAAAAVVLPELSSLPRAALSSALLGLLPTMAVTALAVYGLCAVLLISGRLTAEAVRLRRDLGRIALRHAPTRPDWTETVGRSGLRRLIPPPAAMRAGAAADASVVLQGRFTPYEARREVARLYYIGAARAHFFTALVVLAGAVVLGAAQPYGALPGVVGPIPTVAAALAGAGLVLLAVLARIAVDITAEPLIETIARLPSETPEAGLLRRTAELLAAAAAAEPPRDTAAPAAAVQFPERLGAALEEGQRAISAAIERLSTAADGLATTTRSSIEALEAAFRASELREQTLAQGAVVDTAAVTELRDALNSLTAILQRVREPPPVSEGDAEAGVATAKGPATDLAFELRKLLQEIEAAP